ncbi:cytochrome P450 [Alisedimentitalea sp. MJ-SS2]|uniref:cytochrome P450 n=1 Tax=Aliisedimentitalea sp. MJ-SS2 TaxID=3049795 RepID=UPI00290B0FE5|nr:cytochrome P450 [Alisedimentitalea sp. MJ-SS2]MDU8927999.1 cytochrome P450 [Alisedimentitalea sp. MJ-SS2]
MTVWTPMDSGHEDLYDHDAFARGAPHNTFARMRRDAPLEWSEWDGGEGFWNVTRQEDILALNRDTELMSSARGIRMEDQTYEEYLARRTFQETDAPEHMRTRIKVAKAFSPPVVAAFEEPIRKLCDEILGKALDLGTFDATKEIARQLPMRILGQILGTPDEDLPWLVEKGDALIANTDPDFTDHVLDKMETDQYRMMPFNSPAGAELYNYAKELMAEKNRTGDTNGILHLILQPGKDGEVMPELEFRNFFCLLVAAGNDTTRYSIAAGIQAMAHQQELLGQMKDDADIWKTAPDEIIRWATPALYFRRTATRDFEMHDQRVKEGDKVLLWWASGNRDERVLDDPFRVNLMRQPNPHVSFGQGGPHVCLGMHLARLEIRVLFQELVKRVSKIEPAGPHKFLRSNFVGGIKELPVTMTPS